MADASQRHLRDQPLSAADGRHLYTAGDALLKGVLESEIPVVRLAAPPRPPFTGLLRRATEDGASALLERHGCEVLSVMDVSRAVTLADRAATGGRASLVIVANDQLYYAMPAVQASARRAGGEGGLVLVCEDNPELAPAAPPRVLLAAVGIPCFEPHDLESLRDAVETAARASRISRGPAAIVADVGLLRSLDTLEARPNRIVDRLDAAIAGRRSPRIPRTGDPRDLLRLARRLELNTVRSMPSPGEREPIGLLVAGNAFRATAHMLADLGLAGSVPLVGLGLAHPLDDALIGRLLQRCDEVVVLETRPGGLAGGLAEILERARRLGEQPARLRWRDLSEGGDGERLETGDALLPSRLARRLISRLHASRPGLDIGARLARLPESLENLVLPERGAGLGTLGAVTRVERAVDDADRVLRHGEESTALVTEGIGTIPEIDRVVPVEIWDRKRFGFEGPAAIRQATRLGGPRIMVVCDVGGDGEVDVARVARAAAPEEPSERLAVESVDIHDRGGLKQRLVELAAGDRVAVVIARDGPPPRLDPIAAERELADVDRLGYRPRQRLVLPGEAACERRGRSLRALPDPPPLTSRGWVRRLRLAGVGGLRLRIRPFLEQVDAIRSQPPVAARVGDRSTPMAPRPRHADAVRWRAHIAGVRGEAPGIAAQVLCEAGEAMGYRVQATWDPAPVGRAWRAWTQLQFSRPGGDPANARTSSIPYGEADLLLGVDPLEALRALGPDPTLRVASPGCTTAVINSGPLDDDAIVDAATEHLAEAVDASCGPESIVEDLLRSCRHAFLTERVLDLVLLGFAYQRGLVPISPEALIHAARRLEERGVGRCVDAIAFGRTLADRRPTTWPRDEEGAEPVEPMPRVVRRAAQDAVRLGSAAWSRLRRQIDSALDAMPGLIESEHGRRAAAEFADAMSRAAIWGGHQHAQRLADRVRRLYSVDRGEAGRQLTMTAIRPLAEAMLPRDLFHVSASTLAPRHVAALRSRLRIRPARGDRLERRFLFRVDGIAFDRRFRLDLRTSDWLPILVARLGRFVPWRWRGTPRERALRDAVFAAVEDAVVELGRDGVPRESYQRWVERFRSMRPGDRRLRGGDVVMPRSVDPLE